MEGPIDRIAYEFGQIRVRSAHDQSDRNAAFALRHLCFHGRSGLDRDEFDRDWAQILIEDDAGLLGTFRMTIAADDPGTGYAGRYYDLTALRNHPGPKLELGRFCIAPGAASDVDVLRAAWGALTRIVDAQGVRFLFGCSSFAGTDPAPYRQSLALLADRHLAPVGWKIGRRSPEVVALTALDGCDPQDGLRSMPPLLRSYLRMGGWVSDHAVVDREMNTLHVFTGVEIASIPPARAKALRAISGS